MNIDNTEHSNTSQNLKNLLIGHDIKLFINFQLGLQKQQKVVLT